MGVAHSAVVNPPEGPELKQLAPSDSQTNSWSIGYETRGKGGNNCAETLSSSIICVLIAYEQHMLAWNHLSCQT